MPIFRHHLWHHYTRWRDAGTHRAPCFPRPGPADDNTVYSRTDCLRLAKTITDLSKVPVSCQEVVKSEMASNKAWEGASHSDRAQHAIATSRGGGISHHQLQRRLTTTPSERMSR